LRKYAWRQGSSDFHTTNPQVDILTLVGRFQHIGSRDLLLQLVQSVGDGGGDGPRPALPPLGILLHLAGAPGDPGDPRPAALGGGHEAPALGIRGPGSGGEEVRRK